MKDLIQYLIIFQIFFLISSLSLSAQQSIVIAGGDLSGSSGSASYSVGLPVFNYYSDSDYSMTEGNQQPFESISLGINTNELEHNFLIFPVPTSQVLNIKINNFDYHNLKVEITDLQGKLLISEFIESLDTQLNLSNLEESIYILSFINQGKLIRTQKIIKF